MKRKVLRLLFVPALLMGLACSSHQYAANNNPDTNAAANGNSYKDAVKNALEQADLKGVDVSEARDKNTITLSGKLHSENAKQQAAEIAKAAAGSRIIANEISVEPIGQASEARRIESNVDGAIEKNYKAALISKGLDKQHISYDAKNGVLTLKGTVDSSDQRQEAQQIAVNIPNVQQVLNEIQIRR